MKTKSPELSALKRAKKVLKFWFPILLETEYMNDEHLRKKYQSTLQQIKTTIKDNKNEAI